MPIQADQDILYNVNGKEQIANVSEHLDFLHLNISALKQNFKILDLNSRLTKFVPHKPVQVVKI